ncbi:MAG TPA: hypothetical protein VMW27_22895 [Thermoanaerobaculia bacterium]|nr:hypothetical protein [Thermoanaerobaculia bacterium]
MIPYFKSFGESIERAWREHGFNEDVFPELALQELERNPPSGRVDVQEIVDFVFDSHQEFAQPNNRELFGEPPVMLFQAARFYIEALFWFSGTTDIHEHSFSGVFTVLAGSSVHSHWRFARQRTVNSRMLCGSLERVSTEILRPGDARLIYSGDRIIHQLFHLEVPSVTIVVRTYVDRDHLPQYRYRLPGLATAYDDGDSLRTRRMILLDSMARGQLQGFQEYSRKLIDSGDLETVFQAFSILSRRKIEDAELYEAARRRHGDIVDLFRQALDEERRTRIVTLLRAKVADPEPRFLLALLMLMPDRDSIFETIRLQLPDAEPLALIETWLTAISGKDIIGFNFNEANRLVFRSLVEGLDLETIVQKLKTEFGSEALDSQAEKLSEHVHRMARSDLFRPLFSNSPVMQDGKAAALVEAGAA